MSVHTAFEFGLAEITLIDSSKNCNWFWKKHGEKSVSYKE